MGSGCTEPEYAVAPALSTQKQMRTASAISPAVRPPMTSVQCPTGNYDDSAVTSVAFSLGCAVRVLFTGRDLVERHSRRVGRGRRTSSRGVVQRSACARIETGVADEGRERFVSDTSSSPASPRRRSCALRTSHVGWYSWGISNPNTRNGVVFFAKTHVWAEFLGRVPVRRRSRQRHRSTAR